MKNIWNKIVNLLKEIDRRMLQKCKHCEDGRMQIELYEPFKDRYLLICDRCYRTELISKI
jgi:hypothetical protein